MKKNIFYSKLLKNILMLIEILNDESLLDVFNNRWVVSSKIENLRVRQERIDKTKKEKEHRDMVEKMRALVDTLSEEEQKEFEDKLHTLD